LSTLVLDAGALIAVERRDRKAWALLVEARERGTTTIVPSTALAQAWRGGPRSAPIAMLLAASVVDELDEERAKQVGGRLGASGTSDATDAHVACCASKRNAAVATSDPDDIAALAPASGRLTLIDL
jgi:predicted nucleic acid-binding protein